MAQREVLTEALTELESRGDLINQVIEATLTEDLASVEVIRYDLPPTMNEVASRRHR